MNKLHALSTRQTAAMGILCLMSVILWQIAGWVTAAPSAETYVQQAIGLYNKGNCLKAVDLLKKAIALKPTYARAHSWLGLCYVKLGRNQEAIEAFRRVIRLAPGSDDARIAQQWLNRLQASTPERVPRPVALTWRASPVPAAANCAGPADSGGRPWHDGAFDDSTWPSISLPDVDTWACDVCDRFYRAQFTVTNFRRVTIRFASDDGIEIWLNGRRVGQWGPGCQQGGCVNNPRGVCAINTDVGPVDITRFLTTGRNSLAVHVSTAGGNQFFDLRMTVE